MTKFFRDNSKKLLAVFGVVLMIAFIMPYGMKNGNQRGGSTRLMGHVGPKQEKVTDTELSRAKYYWSLLEHRVMVMQPASRGGAIPFTQFLRAGGFPMLAKLPEEVQRHPELFYLLQREADDMAIVTPSDAVDGLFSAGTLAVQLDDMRVVPFEQVGNLAYATDIHDAVTSILKVLNAAERATSAVKISQPMVRQATASQLQEMRVRYVELNARDFLPQVPAPTREQLGSHFDKYAGYSPKNPGTIENPHGYGYKYPNRVALQYLAIPHGEVRRVVRAMKSDYDWDVDARKYYIRHQSDFLMTDPATTQPGTNPADAFGLSRGSTTRPGSTPPAQIPKPYEQVRDQIQDLLLKPEIDRKLKDVQERVLARLNSDYAKFQAAPPPPAPTTPATTQPTTAPTTSPAAELADTNSAFGSYAYMQKVAADVEKDTKILPTVSSVGDFKDSTQLDELPGIGSALIGTRNVPFGRYATEFSTAVMPKDDKGSAAVALNLLQPSQVLKDANGSIYLFRLTGVKPSAKPASMDEVAADVERDWKNARAYELATKRADALIEEARVAGSLETAANNATLRSIVSGFFDREGNANGSADAIAMAMGSQIDGVTLPPDQLRAFRNGAFNLLSTPAAVQSNGEASIAMPTSNPSDSSTPTTAPASPRVASTDIPLATIPMPLDMKVLATQLLALRPRVPQGSFVNAEVRMSRDMQEAFSTPIRSRWTAYDAVVKRMRWNDVNGPKSSGGSDAPSEE